MSQINVDTVRNRTSTNGGPTFDKGLTVSAGTTAYVYGNLQVDGTETIVNTERLDVADKTVGIASTTAASNSTADGAGIEVYGGSDGNKTVTWVNSTGNWTLGGGGLTADSAIVGSAVTINGSGIKAGIITANSFVGDGSGLTNLVGTGVTNNVNTVNLNVISGVTTLGNDVIFTGATANVTWDKSEDDLVFADNARAKFGTDLDLHIYHNGSNSVIREEGTGNLNIQTTGGNVDILVNTTETAAKFISDGAVELYNNNTKRIETTSSGAITTGIHTVTVGTDLDGYKVEEGSYDTNALNGEFDFELENGHVQTHTGSTAGTYFPDFRVSSSQSLSSVMGVGDVVSATLIVTASNTAHYCTTGIKIDNSTSNVTIEWIGSAAPTAGKGAGYDVYGFTIQKTAATPAYLVIVNATDAG